MFVPSMMHKPVLVGRDVTIPTHVPPYNLGNATEAALNRLRDSRGNPASTEDTLKVAKQIATQFGYTIKVSFLYHMCPCMVSFACAQSRVPRACAR